MPMVRMLVDEPVDTRVWVKGVRTDEMRARELMPKMAVDGVNEKQFPVLVPVVPPWIGSARAECFHNFPLGVITPHRAAQRNALPRRRAWDAHLARTRGAATTIKPRTRTEAQTVGKGVVHVRRGR